MMLIFALAGLLAPWVPLDDVPLQEAHPLTNRHLQVYAWYCDGAGCSSSPRQFDGAVHFDVRRSKLPVDVAMLGAESWTTMLTCRVARDRLIRCRVEPDSTSSAAARDRALALARRLRLRLDVGSYSSARQHPRVLLSILYAAGKCGWDCTYIPEPAGPPG
jgi:hypothetical protein